MIKGNPEGDVAADRLERRWFAAFKAASSARAECEELLEAMEQTEAAWNRARAKEWRSVTNVGYRPTFDGHDLSGETFLLVSLTGDPPGRIEVSFLQFVRHEKKFEYPELLRAQIMKDVAFANRVHARMNRVRGL